jgi:hypothetical membrane protein
MSDTTGTRTSEERPRLTTLTKALLLCGIVSSVLYVGTEVFASMIYPGYSYTAQMVSELGAIGAPTRSLWMTMSMLYNPLVVAFGVGVWKMAGNKRPLRITGILLVAYGFVSGAGPFVPMHMRGAEGSLTDYLHIICTIGMVALMLLFVGFGANASGKGFRVYSIATIVALVVGGALAGVAGGQMAAGGATPWFGILERVNIYGEMLWVLMLSVTLLRGRIGEAAAWSASRRAPALPAVSVPTRRWAR